MGCYGRECAGSDGERVGGMCLFSIPKGKNGCFFGYWRIYISKYMKTVKSVKTLGESCLVV